MTTSIDPSVAEAAERALNAVFQDPPLRFQRSQITIDVRVDQASRLSAGLFKLWSPVPLRSWSVISLVFAKAVIKATGDPGRYKQSQIGKAAAITYRRNLQAHLDDPDAVPCPQYL